MKALGRVIGRKHALDTEFLCRDRERQNFKALRPRKAGLQEGADGILADMPACLYECSRQA